MAASISALRENYPLNETMSHHELYEIGKREAREHYRRFIAQVPERIEIVNSFIPSELSPITVDKENLLRLGEWFVGLVATGGEEDRRWLHSLCLDIYIAFSDAVIKEYGNCEWGLFTWGRKNVSTNHPVVLYLHPELAKHHMNSNIIRATDIWISALMKNSGWSQCNEAGNFAGIVESMKGKTQWHEDSLRQMLPPDLYEALLK